MARCLQYLLSARAGSSARVVELRAQVLDTLHAFLTDEEHRLNAADVEFRRTQNRARERSLLTGAREQLDIKEIDQQQSGYSLRKIT